MNIDDFIERCSADDSFEETLNGETFELCLIPGSIRLQWKEDSPVETLVPTVLARCVLSDGKPIGMEKANELIDRFFTLSNALFQKILEASTKAFERENELWSETKKNSKPELGSTSLEGNIGSAIG